MLSAANPPGPPCPPKDPALNSTDEKAHSPERASSSLEADLEADLDEAQGHQFSIRDYVFSSRSKDIRTNWPFPQQHLQLCLKHGVTDLLPPFEPPDLVRARFSEECAEANHLVVSSGVEGTRTEVDLVGIDSTGLLDRISDGVRHDFSPLTHEPVLSSLLQLQNPLSENKSAVVRAVNSENELIHGEAESKVTSHDHTGSIPSSVSDYPGSVPETRSISESSEEEVSRFPLTENIKSVCEPSVKKCRLIVKFGGAPDPEPIRTEDTVSNFSSVSDPMSSKVCPVCKSFSSTSNTTLNAHIDQCLSAESSAKRVLVKLSQHKVKLKKKRSMEEIYATALHCTLEDLDRRNGTNWALDLTSIAQNNDASCTTESKRPRISPLRAIDDEREGTVYVDSNGTKLLILSKFNDTLPAATVDCFRPQKLRKELTSKRSSPLRKKKWFSQKYKKYWKAKIERKKMDSINHLKTKIYKEDKRHVDIHNEKEKLSQPSNAEGQMKVGKPGTLGQWMCSKRSSLRKPLNGKFGHKRPRNPLAITPDTSEEGGWPAPCDHYAMGAHIQKFSQSSDEIFPPLKTRSTNVVSNDALAAGNQEKHSTLLPKKHARSMGNKSTSNGIKLKLSRSMGNFVSSEKSKRVQMHAHVVQKPGKFLHSTKKGSRRSLVDGPQCPMETIKCNEVAKGMVPKKLRKRRFVEKAHKEADNLPLELVEWFEDSSIAHDLGSADNNVTSEMHQTDFSENIAMTETNDAAVDHVLPSESNIIDSNQANVDYHASEGGEYINYSHLGAECSHAEVIKFDAQIEASANMESLIKCLSESTDKVVTSENHEATTCNRLDSFVLHEFPREPSGANEATMVSRMQKLRSNQGMHHSVISSDIISHDICQVGQMEASVKDDYCSELQTLEHRADVASVHGSSACLSRPGNKVLEGCNSSLVTSDRNVNAHIHNMIADGGSPVSATSTLSHLSFEDLNSKDAEREASEEPIVIQEKSRSYSRNLALLADDSMGAERTDLEKTIPKVKADASAQELEKLWDGQPCCCSQREGISCKSKILRQSVMAGMMLPTRTKQITSGLYIRCGMPSSGVYSHPISEVVGVPILDPPADSISPRASPDFPQRVPSFNNCGSASSASYIHPQTTSSPILRLMGKNLMVMKREEMSEQQHHQSAPCSLEDTLNAKYKSLIGFPSTSFSNQDGIQYHPCQSMKASMLGGRHPSDIQAPLSLPAEPMDCFSGTLLQSGLRMKTDSRGPQKRLKKKPNASGLNNLEKVCPHERQKPNPVTRAPIPERELIVIDDSPEREAEPSHGILNAASTLSPTFSGSDARRVRPLSCYQSQNLFPQRDIGQGLKPVFPISCPGINARSTMWGGNSGSPYPLPPRPLVVPSPSAGQLTPTLYYSPTFR
uniref:Hapless 8 n=1 Tax=Anthurium amnicola TaxID=1678845 RepID=A0A1D1XSP9_9ARAE